MSEAIIPAQSGWYTLSEGHRRTAIIAWHVVVTEDGSDVQPISYRGVIKDYDGIKVPNESQVRWKKGKEPSREKENASAGRS